jgi:hypothetical protein
MLSKQPNPGQNGNLLLMLNATQKTQCIRTDSTPTASANVWMLSCCSQLLACSLLETPAKHDERHVPAIARLKT